MSYTLSEPGAITKEDVDWTKSPIEISFDTTTVIDKGVFDTIFSEHQTVEIVMKSSEYEYYFPTNSVFTLDGSSADMKILRNGGSNYSAILALLERKSITGFCGVLWDFPIDLFLKRMYTVYG